MSADGVQRADLSMKEVRGGTNTSALFAWLAAERLRRDFRLFFRRSCDGPTEGGIESQGSLRRSRRQSASRLQQRPGRDDFRDTTRRARGTIVTPTALRVLSKKWQVVEEAPRSRALGSADLVSATKGDNPFETSKSGDRPFTSFH